MQVKGKKSRKIAVKALVAGALFVAVGPVVNQAMAQVTGQCVNCHTMHNSQGGNEQVFVGDGSGWSAGSLTGGTSTAAQAELLKTDCVGCHTNTLNSATILTIGSSRVPIVYNATGYPAQALAGGNFFSVASSQAYGHNVRGISSVDLALSIAPGDPTAAGGIGGCANSCHTSLTLADGIPTIPPVPVAYQFNGCRGCHTQIAHHNSADPSYRYLGGPTAVDGSHIAYVDGGGVSPGPGQPNPYEDKDWEQSPNSTNHNFYERQDSTDPVITHNVGSFCAGCHMEFHSTGNGLGSFSPTDNGGDPNDINSDGVASGLISKNSTSNPWLRHPSGVNIPIGDATGEYSQMAGVAYSPAIPVAQDIAGNATLIDVGDQVMCLSCHRAHGSDKPDSLRFDYSAAATGMIAHAGTERTDGCFYCHRSKDV